MALGVLKWYSITGTDTMIMMNLPRVVTLHRIAMLNVYLAVIIFHCASHVRRNAV